MNYNYVKLEKSVVKLWYLIAFIVFLAFAGPVWTTTLVLSNGEIKLVPVVISGVLTLIFGIIDFAYPMWKYKNYSYYYDEERIVINKGVFFKHHIVVPVCQIQDLHIYEGPLMQIVKLDGMIISTAGSNFIIKGLSRTDSEKMMQKLENNLHKRLEELKNEELY